MIITAPTGLYEPILPQSPSDPGNYTFTISNQPPPKSSGTFVQLPLVEQLRQAPPRVFTKTEKRFFLGSLVYNITVPGIPATGSGAPQFEVSQVLEFTDEDLSSSDPYSMKSEELRQDLKVVDYTTAGLSEDEYDELKLASENKIDSITSSIASVSSELNSNADSIQRNQANINNSTSLLNNIILVLGSDSFQAVKVKNRLEEFQIVKVELINERKLLQSSLDSLRSELQIVREAVR